MHESTSRRPTVRRGALAALPAAWMAASTCAAAAQARSAQAAAASAQTAVASATNAAGATGVDGVPGVFGGVGPWIFVSVALALVAAASFAAGHWRAAARRASSAAGRAGSTAPEMPGVTATPADPAAPAAPTAATAFPVAAVSATSGPAPTRAASIPSASTAATETESPLQRAARALASDARPLYLFAHSAEGGPRQLLHANRAGLALLGLDAQACGQPWPVLQAMAPAALRVALADSAAPGGWWLLRDEVLHQCLALGPDAAAAEETTSLASTLSHDLRAPLRVIDGFTRIVKEDYGAQLDRVGNDHLERVLAAGARMNQMIDAVLTMTRLAAQPLVRQPVNLSQQAGFIIEELARAAPTREVETLIEPDLVAHGDPTLLRLVLENLLGNAWKYSARTAHARIELFTTTDKAEGKAEVETEVKAAGATGTAAAADRAGPGRRVFVVRDNGAGFDMRAADRLFGLFQRLHSAKDFAGTGVGLASVRRIVQRHGGQIWAEAEPGRGAAFHFTLAE